MSMDDLIAEAGLSANDLPMFGCRNGWFQHTEYGSHDSAVEAKQEVTSTPSL